MHTKPLPAPHVLGNTDAERIDNAARALFSMSKDDLLRIEARLTRTREEKAGDEDRLIGGRHAGTSVADPAPFCHV